MKSQSILGGKPSNPFEDHAAVEESTGVEQDQLKLHNLYFETAVERLRSNTTKYTIIPRFIDLADFSVEKFMTETENKKQYLENVFQTFDKQIPSDRKRKQIVGDTRKCLLPIQRDVTSLLKAAFPDVELSYPQASTLLSLQGCEKQAYHCDFNIEHPDSTKSYACLVALMNGTQLYGLDRVEKSDYFNAVTIQLNAGDLLVFRGDFIHAGSDYAEKNCRIHYYFDYAVRRPEFGQLRSINTTYNATTTTDQSSFLQCIVGEVSPALTRLNQISLFRDLFLVKLCEKDMEAFFNNITHSIRSSGRGGNTLGCNEIFICQVQQAQCQQFKFTGNNNLGLTKRLRQGQGKEASLCELDAAVNIFLPVVSAQTKQNAADVGTHISTLQQHPRPSFQMDTCSLVDARVPSLSVTLASPTSSSVTSNSDNDTICPLNNITATTATLDNDSNAFDCQEAGEMDLQDMEELDPTITPTTQSTANNCRKNVRCGDGSEEGLLIFLRRDEERIPFNITEALSAKDVVEGLRFHWGVEASVCTLLRRLRNNSWVPVTSRFSLSSLARSGDCRLRFVVHGEILSWTAQADPKKRSPLSSTQKLTLNKKLRVLNYLAKGIPGKDIAAVVHVSPAAVSHHKNRDHATIQKAGQSGINGARMRLG